MNSLKYFILFIFLFHFASILGIGESSMNVSESRNELRKNHSRRSFIRLPSWFPWPWRNQKPKGQGNLCYEDLGCFYLGKPWTSTLRPFPTPWHPYKINVTIYLFTRFSPEGEVINLWPSINSKETFFNSKRKTVLLTHGFASHGLQTWLHELKDAYLEKEDVNFFIVDWGNGARHANYLQVASNTRIVGAEISRLLQHLVLSRGVSASKIHLIGHSLGSHIVSYAAKKVAEFMEIGRITALDPAQPGFELQSDTVRLSKNDAKFVDVIHSDAKPTIPFLGFGMMRPVGHVDFYVNGGTLQPGCFKPKMPVIRSIKDLFSYPVEVISEFITCSHSRAYEYFINSIKDENCVLWGSKMNTLQNFLTVTSLGKLRLSNPYVKTIDDCTIYTCTLMGLDTQIFPARGSFMVTTTTQRPYCSKYYI